MFKVKETKIKQNIGLRKAIHWALICACLVWFLNFQLPPSGPARAAATAALPQVFLDTTYPALSASRNIRNVKPSCSSGETLCYTSLQSAINDAVPGDEIVITAGMTITGPITLKHKTGGGWIIIRSSNMSALPAAGHRVGPSDAAAMPKIVAPGSNVSALVTEDNADNYRLVGIEFTKVNPSVVTGVMVQLGRSDGQTSYSQVPKNLILDRDYIHGDPASDLKRCVELDSSYTSIIDSYISECHVVGQDAQGITALNGQGPFKIVDNYVEASTENILFGGDVPRISGLVPSDIEVRGNYLTKDLAWKDTTPHWAVKNDLEFKNAQRVLVTGNIIENDWLDGQTGTLIVITPRNSGGCRTCGATWATASDLTITDNIVRHGAGALEFQGYDYYSSDGLDSAGSLQVKNVYIANNLFYDISRDWDAKAPLILMSDQPANITLDHNTFINSGGNNLTLDSSRSDGTYDTVLGLTLSNNTMFHTSYGVMGGGLAEGNSTMNAYTPGAVFTHNILASDTSISSRYPSANICGATCYPTEATWESQFLDYNQAIAGNISDFALNSGSAYKNAGTDGKDLGADIAAISSATASAAAGSDSGGGNTTSDTTKPVVASFTVAPQSGSGPVTATFTATDSGGSFLASAELLRANANTTSCLLGNISGCSWTHLQTIAAPSGVNSWTSSFTDSPPAGTYLYGTHVHDGAGNIGFEPAVVSAIVGSSSLSRSISIQSLQGKTSKAVTGTLDILDSGHNLLNSYPFTTNASGSATLSLNVPIQSVFLRIRAVPYLVQTSSADLNLTGAYSIPMLRTGDINQDNIVNSIDFSLLNAKWFSADAISDLNGDGLVNSLDFSLLNQNWFAVGN
ncbi:MAG TPA: dockerin type I domain-containing protein [Patescibacteria group bacterium]|nr:dockerin type I domain-containing protein [Patescibacteria group bacterium]